MVNEFAKLFKIYLQICIALASNITFSPLPTNKRTDIL